MALAKGKSRIKKERQGVYCDIMCGLVQSIISLSGIIYIAILNRITSIKWFITGLTFWICYLMFSILLLCYGLYSHYREKHFDVNKYKKDIKAPII